MPLNADAPEFHPLIPATQQDTYVLRIKYPPIFTTQQSRDNCVVKMMTEKYEYFQVPYFLSGSVGRVPRVAETEWLFSQDNLQIDIVENEL